MNRGFCTWTPDYALVFSHGARMQAPTVVSLTEFIEPGEQMEVSVNLTVPETPGRYVGYWMLRSASGVLFGSGQHADQPFFVDLHAIRRSSAAVAGRVCYPSERIPAMTIYLQRANSDQVVQVRVLPDQVQYQAALEPGSYVAYAWTDGYQAGGAYTYPDHSLRPFEIKRGMTVQNIDICDWYGGPGSVPYPPDLKTGTISGHLGFPSEFIPPLRVVAFNTRTGNIAWVDTALNQHYYEINGLIPGDYTVVAYYRSSHMAGGYTRWVACGMSSACIDHGLIAIDVEAGARSANVDPIDWYAPPGTFPSDPTT
jgi:hypothetical protein